VDRRKKILIVSDEDDISTNDVLRWISYYGVDYLRVNNTSSLNFIEAKISNEKETIIFEYNDTLYDLADFTGYWYRRGRLNFKYDFDFFSENEILLKSISEMLNNELTYLNNFVYYFIEKYRNIRHIGSIHNNKTNKLSNLLIAKSVGLNIPETFIANEKKRLKKFIEKTNIAITKPIYQRGIEYSESNIYLTGLTSVVSSECLSSRNEKLTNSLLQSYIEKKYELRIFFLNDKYFTSVIFSQNDEMTKIDFRNYNSAKPNRTPPFTLPKEILDKLKKCMAKIGLNSGSIDMIVTPENDFVFLEVNPVGMFWQVSYPCNYYLEREIAKYLCEID
jgi:ATP-GRASP peptide maturase of grasp-with-spasm system